MEEQDWQSYGRSLLVCRATALVQMHITVHARPSLEKAFRDELPYLLPRLVQCMNHPTEGFFQTDIDARDPCSTRGVQKRALALTALFSARTLHLAHSESQEGWAHRWRSRCEDDFTGPARVQGKTCHSVLTCPSSPSTTISADILRWGWRDLLGIDQPGEQALCGRVLASGFRCGAVLDACHQHCSSCDWGVVVLRHHCIQGLLAKPWLCISTPMSSGLS